MSGRGNPLEALQRMLLLLQLRIAGPARSAALTQADEKAINNERTKLTSTALNNISVAIVVTGFVVPIIGSFLGAPVADPVRRYATSVSAMLAGFVLHALARKRLEGIRA